MSESPVIQEIYDFYCFAVFNPSTKELLYSKYNFDFTKYKEEKSISDASNNSEVFHHFLTLNESDLWKPFTVKNELKQYFSTITLEIQEYFDLYNYVLWDFNFRTLETQITWDTTINNQFDLIYYDYFTEIPIVCEFLHDDGDSILSKYNFDFDRYSLDFNVYGSKLSIFYDLLLRITFLSDNSMGYVGFNNIPEKFKNYFFTDGSSQTRLSEYLEKYSVFSSFTNVKHSIENIDFDIYKTYIENRGNIIFNSTREAKIYYLTTGQFQQDELTFIKDKDNLIQEFSDSVCTVIASNDYGTGFLIRGPTDADIINGAQQIYLVTCYHIIHTSEKNTLFASCNYKGTTIQLMFRIIGFDKHADICICMYDDTLLYNAAFYPEDEYNIRGNLKLINIISDVKNYMGEKICTVGNPSLVDNESYMEGIIMDTKYSGNFNGGSVLSYPATILTNMHVSIGQSGSPVCIIDETNKLQCIGMINSNTGTNRQYCVAINNNLFKSIVFNGITTWFSLVRKYGKDDIKNLSYYSQHIFPKKWLGITFGYYNPVYSYSNMGGVKELKSFPYVGGVLIHNFILGFNNNTKQFVTKYDDLSQQNITKIDTPLLQSKMYSNFILSNNVPIVLKSIKIYDGVNGEYKTFVLGKYKNQVSMECITYNFIQNGTVENSPEFTNLVYRKFPKIIFEYYYYNGKVWILETEEIGGNDETWYNIYKDSLGNTFYQHKWEFPLFIAPYLEPFSGMSSLIGGRGNLVSSSVGLEFPQLNPIVNPNLDPIVK